MNIANINIVLTKYLKILVQKHVFFMLKESYFFNKLAPYIYIYPYVLPITPDLLHFTHGLCASLNLLVASLSLFHLFLIFFLLSLLILPKV